MHLTAKTFNEKVKPPSDGSAHIQGGGHNQHPQLPTNNISPVKSFHTTVKNEDDKMTISQPLMEVCCTCTLISISKSLSYISITKSLLYIIIVGNLGKIKLNYYNVLLDYEYQIKCFSQRNFGEFMVIFQVR